MVAFLKRYIEVTGEHMGNSKLANESAAVESVKKPESLIQRVSQKKIKEEFPSKREVSPEQMQRWMSDPTLRVSLQFLSLYSDCVEH